MANDLDRLFRETLDQVEVTPKASSWEQVQGQISEKKAYWILPRALAAAVALLVVVSWVLWDGSNDRQTRSVTAQIDHPVVDRLTMEIEVPTVLQKRKVQMAQEEAESKSNLKSRMDRNVNLTFEKSNYEMLSLVAKREIDLSTDLPVNYQIEGLESIEITLPTVKITYIASNSDANKPNKIGSFLSSLSSSADPTELLADIRDAKDNLFSRN